MTIGLSQSNKMKQKIEAARIALITERLDLSPKEAEKFWPVYNEFTSQRRSLRDSYRQERLQVKKEEMTEDQRKEVLQQQINLKQRELDLEKQYSNKVLDVISTKQMMSLRTAERDFKRMLLERVQNNRGRQVQQQQLKQRQQQKQRNNNN
jgi:hypothetical protein